MRSHQSAQSEQDKRIKSLKLDIAALTEYLGNARKNYDELAQFLQDERILRKEKEAKVNELQEALKKEKERTMASSPAQVSISSPSPQQHNRPPSSSPYQQQQQQRPTTPVSHQPSPTTSPHVQHPSTPANVTEQSIAASTVALRARITELERQLIRSAKGRQAIEKEMLNHVRQGSELRAQVQELKTELAKMNALVQSNEQTNVQLRSDLERTQQAFGAWMHQFSTNNPQLSQPQQRQQQQRPNTQQQQQPISPTHNITPQQQLSMPIPHSSPPMTMAPNAVANIPQQQQQQPSSSAVYNNSAAPNFRLALPERRVQYDQHHHPQQHH